MRRTLSLLAFALATICACSRDPEPQLDSAKVAADPLPPSPPPEVEFAGCQATRTEPLTCWLRTETTKLNLWVPARVPPIVEIDGASPVAHVRPSAGETGWTIAVDVPREASLLSVRVGRDSAAWTLRLEATEPTPFVDQLQERLLPANEPDADQLEAALAMLDRAEQLSDYEQILAGRLRALVLNDLGRPDDALQAGYEAIDRALRTGHVDEGISIVRILLFVSIRRNDAAEVQYLLDLDTFYSNLSGSSALEGRGEYYRGFWASMTGDYRVALENLESAEAHARRLGLLDDELAAASLRAPLLGLLGRHAERARIVDRILAVTIETPRDDRCRSAVYLSNAGWALLLARGHRQSDDIAARLFERALAFYSPGGGCEVGSSHDRSHDLQEARINFALEALSRSDWTGAAERESAIDALALDRAQRSWLMYIRGELALANNDPDAAIAALADAPTGDDPLLDWQSTVLRARALELLGRHAQALEAYLQAEDRLDSVVLRLGVDQGREGLVAGTHSSAAGALRLQLAQGDVAGAVTSARRSRGRALRPIGRAEALARVAPEQRRRWHDAIQAYRSVSRIAQTEVETAWRLPQDERDRVMRAHERLRREMRTHLQEAYAALSTPSQVDPPRTSPTPGETWLIYHPIGDDWLGLAVTSKRSRSARISVDPASASPTSLASALLDPFTAEIDAAETIAILAMGDLESVEFQALPWRGAALLAAKPVVYRLDITVPPAGDDAGSSNRRALIVADPSSMQADAAALPMARAEGNAVANQLRGAAWQVTLLAGDAAGQAAVSKELERADWLHYAGHGLASSGWDSALPLAGETRLEVRDIFALSKVPSTIVLSGCRTAALDRSAAVGGQHLASAFILAGSRFVIATSADVQDAEAKGFADAFYRVAVSGKPLDGPSAMRHALLDLARDGEGGFDRWQHFRAWVP
ncbi:MAG TPA: CHAT domain-containing protein [Nannocystaceae bacterium]|nr:CHAT domain-containing protein [Nannocystaceae bacterium]